MGGVNPKIFLGYAIDCVWMFMTLFLYRPKKLNFDLGDIYV